MQAIRERGLRVPEDISVVGSDDIVTTSILSPPLTIMWRDMAVFGHKAAELLVSRMQGYAGPPRRVVLPTELILRRSCAPPAGLSPRRVRTRSKSAG
jgi:LacI family transcriptional regulator